MSPGRPTAGWHSNAHYRIVLVSSIPEFNFTFMRKLQQSNGQVAPRMALIATAIGATAIGAFAIGALAIGRLLIRNLSVDRAKLCHLEIGDLDMSRLRARNLVVTDSLEIPSQRS